MEMVKMKMIDFRKMQLKTFLIGCEKQYFEKTKKKLTVEQKINLKLLFKILQIENNIPIQVNYFYLECLSKPLDRFTLLSHFQDYDEILFEDKRCFDMVDRLGEEKFDQLYHEEMEKLNKKVFSILDILEKINISKFDEKYETEFSVKKYFYDQIIENYKLNN